MEQKQPFQMITLNLENGEQLAAPVGVWLSAMLAALAGSTDPEIKKVEAKVKELVGNMVKDRQSKIIKPQRNHILYADPLHLGMKVRPMGGNGNG